jgi:hypothetical protein
MDDLAFLEEFNRRFDISVQMVSDETVCVTIQSASSIGGQVQQGYWFNLLEQHQRRDRIDLTTLDSKSGSQQLDAVQVIGLR